MSVSLLLAFEDIFDLLIGTHRESGITSDRSMPVASNHVGQLGRRSPFSVFLEQLKERHRTMFIAGGVSARNCKSESGMRLADKT